MSEIGGSGPLPITPQMRAAQSERMQRVQHSLETGPTAVAQLTPERAAAQYGYYNQVQADIGLVRSGVFPALPPL